MAGIAELKRRYQDVDEHFNFMLKENYRDKDFEKSYFIPTGFIEVELENGDIAFLKASDLIKKKIGIDVHRLKVSILKNTLLYFVEDLSREQNIEAPLLNTAFDLTSCTHDCVFKSGNFGDLVKKLIEIQNSSKQSNEKTLALIAFYKNMCKGDQDIDALLADYRKKKDKNLGQEDIRHYFKFVLQYPDLSISHYRKIASLLKDSRLVPYALVNQDKELNEAFKKLAIEALDSGLGAEGLQQYFGVAKAFGDKKELTPSYYAHLLSFLSPDYLEWVIGPYYRNVQKEFGKYKITVEECIHLINFAGGKEVLIELLRKRPKEILALSRNRASTFWVFPNRQNQLHEVADLVEKKKK